MGRNVNVIYDEDDREECTLVPGLRVGIFIDTEEFTKLIGYGEFTKYVPFMEHYEIPQFMLDDGTLVQSDSIHWLDEDETRSYLAGKKVIRYSVESTETGNSLFFAVH